MKEKLNFQNLKNKRIDSVSLFVQIILLAEIIILLFASIMVPFLLIPLQFLIVLLLFAMGYNNYKIFKRKGFTIVYFGFGIAYLIALLLGW